MGDPNPFLFLSDGCFLPRRETDQFILLFHIFPEDIDGSQNPEHESVLIIEKQQKRYCLPAVNAELQALYRQCSRKAAATEHSQHRNAQNAWNFLTNRLDFFNFLP